MKIEDHLGKNIIDELYRKVINRAKNNKSNHIKRDHQRETERLMDRYRKTLHKKGGVWK